MTTSVRILSTIRACAVVLLFGVLTAGARAQSGAACTHYVSPTGNDTNTGTAAGSPWRNIGRANVAGNPAPTGSVVCIVPGTYYEVIEPRRAGVTYRALTENGRYDVVVSGLDPNWIGGPGDASTWSPVQGYPGLYVWTWTPRSTWETSPDGNAPGASQWFAGFRKGLA